MRKHRVQHVFIHLKGRPVSYQLLHFHFMQKEKDWFKIKRYPHIGRPLKPKDRPWVTAYVTNPENVKSHSFYPFIHRTNLVRKFRKEVSKETGERSKQRVLLKPKSREIYYANHLDSCVYSYYAQLLNEQYEKKLSLYGLNNVVTAYRRIKLNPDDINSVHKSSADFATDVFSYILDSQSDQIAAITFDIKGFFDNLNHKCLKRAWYEVRDVTGNDKTLPQAEYNVFKNITNFAFVNDNQLFNEFQDQIITETKSGLEKRKKIKKYNYLRNQGAIAFCELEDITRIKQKKLIVANGSKEHPRRMMGIPQGSPISAVLANVYMLNFDKEINNVISELGGIYRRYSDDMIVVCGQEYIDRVIELFDEQIKERQLEIQHDKTQIFKFNRVKGRYECSQQYAEALHPHENLEYLGFEFDGYYSFLKSSSLSSFYRKMKRKAYKCHYYAKTTNAHKDRGQVFVTRMYKKFSYKGAARRRIYKQDKADPNNWIRTDTYDWGNYISYAHLAANKLPHNKIRRQIRRHWSILNKLLK